MAKEEEFWYVHSRTNWLQHGDQNTKYFHHHAGQRMQKNHIACMTDGGGMISDEQIEEAIMKYYETLFTSTGSNQEYGNIF